MLFHPEVRERGQVEELAGLLTKQGIKVTAAGLDNGDYERILDAVANCDTVVHWSVTAGD